LGASGLLCWRVREGCCKGLGVGFGLQIYTCMHLQRLAYNPWHKPLATISTKRCIDMGRVYQPVLRFTSR
jgi:hypothetical protein